MVDKWLANTDGCSPTCQIVFDNLQKLNEILFLTVGCSETKLILSLLVSDRHPSGVWHPPVSWWLPDAHCCDALDNFPAKFINELGNSWLMGSCPVGDAHRCTQSRSKGGHSAVTVVDQRKGVKPWCHSSQRVSNHARPTPIGQPWHNGCHTVDRLTYWQGWVVTPHCWASLSISETIGQPFVNQLSALVSWVKIIIDRSPTLPPQV